MMAELLSENGFLWTCLWQSTACVAAGLIGSFILRHRPARAHQVLLLAMIAAVAMPAMSVLVRHLDLGLLSAEPAVVRPEREIALPETTYASAEIGAGDFIDYEALSVEPAESGAAAPVVAETTQIPWALLLASGWIAASLILAARLAVTFVRGIRLLRSATPLDSASIQKAVRIAKAKLRVTKDILVRSSESISSPVIWCWAKKPVFLVPSDDMQTGDKIDWVSVLCHELAHYRRRDHLSGLLAELAVCILPWNALLWWAKGRLVRLSEQACDDWVVATGQAGPDYAKLLLDLLPQSQMAFIPTVVGSKKELQARVSRLVHGRCGNPRAGSRWAVLVTVLAACLALGTALAQERRADREPPRQEPAAPAYRPEREVPREPGPEQREAERAELMQHRRELLEQISGIERELKQLPDDRDVEARELQDRLSAIHEEVRRIDAQLGGPEREREMRSRELVAEREGLQKRLHELEMALERLPAGQDAEAREIQANVQRVQEQIHRIKQELTELQRPPRERRERKVGGADAHTAELMRQRGELIERARQIKHELTQAGDTERAEKLREEEAAIREKIEAIEGQLRGTERQRPEQARLEELLRNIERLRAQGKHDEAERLEREVQQIEQHLAERPELRAEPRPEGLQREVQQLRGEVMQLRREMQQMREMIQQLLQQQRGERERIPQAERREREPRREGEQIGVERPRF